MHGTIPPQKMAANKLALLALLSSLLAIWGCSRRSGEVESPASGEAKRPVAGTAIAQLTEAERAVKSGELEAAAAQLLQMRIKQKDFSPAEASQYRMVFQDAYERALAAAAKGDPKGVAAMQMLRVGAAAR